MIVAILSTKMPILQAQDFWIFHLPKFARYGFWSMMHEARADFTILLGAIYLLIEGAGQISVDAYLDDGARHGSQPRSETSRSKPYPS
jgi:putative oxidoreductase